MNTLLNSAFDPSLLLMLEGSSFLGSAKYLLITLLATGLMLGIIIALHELGHLLMARLSGVAVEAYSIGFGKKLFARKWGETEYQLRMLPLGGFAKIHGMFDESAALAGEDEEQPDFGEHRKFDNKGYLKKVLILAGGALFNFITAYVIFFGAVFAGYLGPSQYDLPPIINEVVEGGPAHSAGLRSGDQIISMDGDEVASVKDAEIQMILTSLKPYPVIVQRGSETLEVTVTPRKVDFEGNIFGDLGMDISYPVEVRKVTPDSPAEKMGLTRGDRIVTLNGENTGTWDVFLAKLKEFGHSEITLTVKRNGEMVTLSGLPNENKSEEQPYLLGFAIGFSEPPTFASASRIAGEELVDNSMLLFRFVGKLLSRKASMTTMSSPIGIGTAVGKQANSGQGLWPLMLMAAMISVQLGIFNLLPIPALDGGHILVVTVESLLRRTISPQNKIRIIQVGFLALFSLFLVILGMDVMKIVKTKLKKTSTPAQEAQP